MRFLLTAVFIICLVAQGTPIYASPNSDAVLIAFVQSRETWRSIRTNNLFVVGNTGEEDLRQVAVWLEFFHSAFAQLVSRSVLDASVPTTVIVFRDDASFIPFKPIYQGRPADVAGYFQPGQDMNYIALSLERGGGSVLRTAFHEYVHLHLRDNVPNVPLWLNEGLAELYGSYVHSNNEALLGVPIPFYIRLLGQQGLVPLTTLFSIDTGSPHYNEQDKSGIFYAQSWALVHYLMLGEGGRRQSQFKSFLSRVSMGDEADRAIESAFGMNLETLEKEFKDYVRRAEFASQRVAVGTGPTPFIAMQRTAISEGEANFYLGDLLLHINRETDAEIYFKRALSLDPGFTQTYASLGLLCVRQRRYAEARKYLSRAVVSPQSYLIHYFYAYVLSREGMSAGGEVSEYSTESVKIMRDELRKAIKLAPEFADAYYLLAFVNLVEGSQLDEAVNLAKQAQKLVPSKLGYSLLLATIYISQRNLEAAREVLEPLARQTGNASVRANARELLDSFNSTEGGSSANRSARNENVGNSVMRELDEVPTSGPKTVTGGSISEAAIRDGQTIDNSGPMPSLDEVMERFIQSVGGAKALTALTSRVAKGTVDIVGVSRGGITEIYTKAPNKSLIVIQAHPFGLLKLGFNGKEGWLKYGGGVRLANGPDLRAMQRDSDFYDPTKLKASYPKITLLGKSKIGYREVYLLELQLAAGMPDRLYLESTTYLPVRVNAVRRVQERLASVEIYLDDWREVDGIKIPFRITQSSPGLTLSFSLKEIRHNVALDDSLFEKPPK